MSAVGRKAPTFFHLEKCARAYCRLRAQQALLLLLGSRSVHPTPTDHPSERQGLVLLLLFTHFRCVLSRPRVPAHRVILGLWSAGVRLSCVGSGLAVAVWRPAYRAGNRNPTLKRAVDGGVLQRPQQVGEG